MSRLAGVEGGGTTWVACIAEGAPDNIVERFNYKTTISSPTTTEC